MSASSATLIQFPSFALNDILLPSHHTSSTKHGYHSYHYLSTSSLCFRVNSTNGNAPAPAPVGRASTTGKAISYLHNECELHLSLSQIKTLVAQYPKILSRGADLRKTCTPNITLLRNDFGFTKDKVVELLFKYPRAFLLKTEMLKDRLVMIQDKWGFSRDSGMFLRAIVVFCGTDAESIESRCQVFKSFGWSDSDILKLVRANPSCIGMSEANIRKSLEFCMNELRYDSAYLSTRPNLISMSLDTRVLPRHRVLSILKENLFVKSSYQFYSCLWMSEDKFVEKFILPYEKVLPNLRQVYNERPSTNSDAESHEEVSKDDTDH